jgi:hypothetical protein
MEAVRASEKSTKFYQTTQRHIAEASIIQNHRVVTQQCIAFPYQITVPCIAREYTSLISCFVLGRKVLTIDSPNIVSFFADNTQWPTATRVIILHMLYVREYGCRNSLKLPSTDGRRIHKNENRQIKTGLTL